MSAAQRQVSLSVVIAVVSGKQALRRCLDALCPQIDPDDGEIIVPYDRWSRDVAELSGDFPTVQFHYVDALGIASSADVSAHAHRLYDRRRAVGLALASGLIIAMTEDHAVPAPNWCHEIVAAHQQAHAVIGGAIDNAVDAPINWALYYCDFGRFGNPLRSGPAEYVSDVNLAYKRSALDAIRPLWREAYHETTVHWALRARGESLYLDSRLVVHQHRPTISLHQAYAERIQWGRVFAETRAAAVSGWRSACYAAATPFLPFLLAARILRNMLRQGRSIAQIAVALPLAAVLCTGWSLGEFLGYVAPSPDAPLAPSGAEVTR
jgi:hypothetical protein